MELQGDGLVSGNVREITVGGQPSGLGVRLHMKGPADTGYATLPRKVTRTFPPGRSNWQSFIYVEYVRTSGPVKYGLADVAINTRLGRIWVPDTVAFPQNRLIHSISMARLELSRPACSIETGSLEQQVSLGEYNGAKLRNGQDVPGWRPFQLTMAACADPSNLLADITFGTAADADANDPTAFYMNAGGPGGYGIAIETADGAHRMLPGQPREFHAIGTGQGYAFRARLQRTIGTISSGRVHRPVAVRVTFR